uniref:Translin family protein n=1 Tax=Musa acuminata subsp. malaccensis TaxID=214687 RepID=A0A804L375_MUSAM|nr:PREDICTED: translin [Musa acuminata subsp. malaccensis]XP_009382137.1 PREDICTED: translin [Musa acuminata subsp. malaccensis]
MRGAFRIAAPIISTLNAGALRLSRTPPALLLLERSPRSSFHRLFSGSLPMANRSPPPSTSTTASETLDSSSSSMEKQFEGFRVQLEESGNVRERIRAVVMEMEGAVRLMHSSLLLVHHTRPNPEVLEKAKVQIEVLKDLFGGLAEILRECPGQYYRYHGDWRSETQAAVSLIAFLHWLETGNLLVHAEAEKKLGLDNSEFGLDIEDYLIGICFMSNELPRYVVNQVTAGDYDCPKNVLKFLTNLHSAFRMLNLRNDFLRKKFDGMKYDLRKVEEVYYDVKIRGLGSGDTMQGHATQA